RAAISDAKMWTGNRAGLVSDDDIFRTPMSEGGPSAYGRSGGRCQPDGALGPMMPGLGGPYGAALRTVNEGLRGGGACREWFVVRDAVRLRMRRLARGTAGAFLAMMSSRDLRGRAGAALHLFGCDRQLEQGGARALVCGVGGEAASVVGLDNLRLGWSRVDKAISRIVGAVGSGRRVEDGDAGPIVRRRGIDHRHAAAHRSVVPIGVVDEDLVGADDSGDHRDVTRGNALRALEDED